MAVSKGIMELHSGTISVHSEGEGRGCTFTIEIPLHRTMPVSEESKYIMDRVMPMSSKENDNNLNRLSVSSTDTLFGSTYGTSKRKQFLKNTLQRSSQRKLRLGNRLLHILVVDDAALNRKMLVRLLAAKCDYVHEACDGKQALEMVCSGINTMQG